MPAQQGMFCTHQHCGHCSLTITFAYDRCRRASVCLVPAWLQQVRDSQTVAFLKSAAGPVISYMAALLLALGCTATIFLVIAAKTQSIPLYSREGGLQLVSAEHLQLNRTNGSWHASTVH